MDLALRRLCIEVLSENILSQEFNELLIETGVTLESPEWEMTNKMLSLADKILLSLGGKTDVLH